MCIASYIQLENRALALLASRVETLGSKAAVAKELGVARTAVSQALVGKYPANAARLAAKILSRYADALTCPFLGRVIPQAECREWQKRPFPTGSPAAVKHWQACRNCPNRADDAAEAGASLCLERNAL